MKEYKYNSVDECVEHLINTEKLKTIEMWFEFPKERDYINYMLNDFHNNYKGNYREYLTHLNELLNFKIFVVDKYEELEDDNKWTTSKKI